MFIKWLALWPGPVPGSSEASFQKGVPAFAAGTVGGPVLVVHVGVVNTVGATNAEKPEPAVLVTVSANMLPLSATTAAAAIHNLFINDLPRPQIVNNILISAEKSAALELKAMLAHLRLGKKQFCTSYSA
jgi:hypothetical protein